MKKLLIILASAMLLTGCGTIEAAEGAAPETSAGTTPETSEESTEETTEQPQTETSPEHVSYSCELGAVDFELPDGWAYQINEYTGTEDNYSALFSIEVYPEDSDGLRIEYCTQFGVCGTGLDTVESETAGINTLEYHYDNSRYWTFLSFGEPCENFYILSRFSDEEWETYHSETMQLLDSLTFDQTAE